MVRFRRKPRVMSSAAACRATGVRALILGARAVLICSTSCSRRGPFFRAVGKNNSMRSSRPTLSLSVWRAGRSITSKPAGGEGWSARWGMIPTISSWTSRSFRMTGSRAPTCSERRWARALEQKAALFLWSKSSREFELGAEGSDAFFWPAQEVSRWASAAKF